MKKLIGIFCLCLMIGICGCASEKEETVKQQEKKEETEVKEEPEKQEEEQELTDENIQQDEQKPEMEKAIVYFIDDSGNVAEKSVEASNVDEQFLWEQLQDNGTVSAEAQLISMNVGDQGQMELEVDGNFGEQLRSLGTAGEQELLKCVVNSYLDTFFCEKVRITENGDALVSSHKEYADYIERME